MTRPFPDFWMGPGDEATYPYSNKVYPLSFSPLTFINFFVSCDVTHVRKGTRLSPLFRTARDGKLGGAWERGYHPQCVLCSEVLLAWYTCFATAQQGLCMTSQAVYRFSLHAVSQSIVAALIGWMVPLHDKLLLPIMFFKLLSTF